MGRNTNLCNRRHREQAYTGYTGLAQKGMVNRMGNRLFLIVHPTSNPAEGRSLRPTLNRGKERSNLSTALLRGVGVHRMLREVGLPKKPTPWGKPRDTLTWARLFGW
jgi:hypothetical protein